MTTTSIPDRHRLQEPQARTGHRVLSSLAGAAARLATWRVWALTAAVFAVSAGVFFASSAPVAIPRVEAVCRQVPLDMRFTSSAADVMDFLTACGGTGRDAYRLLQVADLFYPAVFGAFMATSIALVLSRLAPARRALLALAALPVLAAGFDYLENVCAWLALAAFPGPAPTSGLLGLASAVKNVASWASGVLLLGALAVLVILEAGRRLRASAHRAAAQAPGGH
jgi:hypothetical protein